MIKQVKNKWTIVQNSVSLKHYEFEAIDSAILEQIEAIQGNLSKSANQRVAVTLKLFECFLQITNTKLQFSCLSKKSFGETICCFVGALASKNFMSTGINGCSDFVHCFFSILEEIKNQILVVKFERIRILKSNVSEIEAFKQKFERLKLNHEKVYYWRGWWLESKIGKRCFANLTKVYKRFGYDFTEKLYQACQQYFYTRCFNWVTFLPELCCFLVENAYTDKQLQDEAMIMQFFQEFLAFVFKKHFQKGNDLRVVSTHWRNRFMPFVKEYLIGNIFAKPYGELPMPPARYLTGHETYIRRTPEGSEIKEKLLTDVPLSVSDTEAMEILFYQIEADIHHVVDCAMAAAQDMVKRYEKRRLLARQGVVIKRRKKHKNSRKAELYIFENTCATFEYYGFKINSCDQSLKAYYPYSHVGIAFNLALPTCFSLLPFLFLLVTEHPAITASFLDNVELYDKQGKQTGYVKLDKANVLIGYKKRRGEKYGQQTIILSKKSQWLVEWLIKLTDEARQFLKSQNNDAWRYLLLSSGSAFAYPQRIGNIHKTVYAWKRKKSPDLFLKQLLTPSNNVRKDRVKQVIRRLNLSSLRASCAVLVYLKTRSVSKMAFTLGHKRYNTQLIAHYLPEPIRTFFQARWIRIFQEGIVVEALKESPYLLEATSFKDIHELDQFLSQHALKLMLCDQQREAYFNKVTGLLDKVDEIIFSVDVMILTIFVALNACVKKATHLVSAKVKYWSEIGSYLIHHIESKPNSYEEAYAYLKLAKEKAKSFPLEDMIDVTD